MPCKVCGDPKTVRSHLLPKAIIKDVRGDHHTAFAGMNDKFGTLYTQGGSFDDDLLCRSHEDALADCDDYVVRFLRSFNKIATLPVQFEGMVYLVPNTKPELMLKFALSCIWRHAQSRRFGTPNPLNLGPWENTLTRKVFYGGNFDPDLCIMKQDFLIGGEPMRDLVMSPYHNPAYGRRAFEIYLRGFRFTIKLDDRQKGRIPSVIRANGANPLPVLNLDPVNAIDVPQILQIFVNMQSKQLSR